MSLYKKYIRKPLRYLINSKVLLPLISLIIFLYTKLIGISTRWKVKGLEKLTKVAVENNGVIFVIWHGRTLLLPFFKNKNLQLSALVSPHRDGRIIAGVLPYFGINVVDGSSNEKATCGALGLMRALKHGQSICIIPDGPRGPRMVMGKSPFYYAQKTGKPIIGGTYSIKNSIRITKAWDHMMIPFPFSKGVCKVTDPMYIPRNASAQEIDDYRKKLEQELNQLTFECDSELGLEPTLPSTNQRACHHFKK